MSKLTPDVKQQEIVKQQKNKLAQLQSIIFAQNKEISELKLKIERQAFYIPSHCGHQLQNHVDAVSPTPDHTCNYLNIFKFTDYAKRKSSNIECHDI